MTDFATGGNIQFATKTSTPSLARVFKNPKRLILAFVAAAPLLALMIGVSVMMSVNSGTNTYTSSKLVFIKTETNTYQLPNEALTLLIAMSLVLALGLIGFLGLWLFCKILNLTPKKTALLLLSGAIMLGTMAPPSFMIAQKQYSSVSNAQESWFANYGITDYEMPDNSGKVIYTGKDGKAQIFDVTYENHDNSKVEKTTVTYEGEAVAQK